MPVARSYAMDDVLAACRHYIKRTGRRVIFEYALVHGVNAAPEQAVELAARLRGMQCHVNLIPLNSVPERGLTGVSEREVDAFKHVLEQKNISVTRRRDRRKGSGKSAADNAYVCIRCYFFKLTHSDPPSEYYCWFYHSTKV